MILVRLMGGLGNQMFQYAFGYYLAKKNNTVLKIDETLLQDKSQPHEIVTHRSLELMDVFDLNINKASKSEIEYFNGKANTSDTFERLINSFLWRLRKHNLIIEKSRSFNPEMLYLKDNKCIVGAWQCENYFSSISSDIKALYKFKYALLPQSIKLAQDIVAGNSICVHIRRGDYVTSKLYSSTIGAMDLTYYRSAIELMVQKVDTPRFYIFSDDLTWCKENVIIPFDHTFVEDEHVGIKAGNYLQLMSLCKNYIISNSTFSWWAAWLGEKENSLIIGPANWFRDKSLNGSDILPKRWVKL